MITHADGQDALDWLRTGAERPCVILIDLMMPHMDGLQLRTELLNDPQLALIPVVVLSADPSAIVAAKSLNFAGSLRTRLVQEDLEHSEVGEAEPRRLDAPHRVSR